MKGSPNPGGTRWLLVQADGERWVFPFLKGQDRVVLAGGGQGAQLPLPGSSPLAFYFEETREGIRLVRGTTQSLRADGALVTDALLLSRDCLLEAEGRQFCLQVRLLPPQEYPAVDDQAETREVLLEVEEAPTEIYQRPSPLASVEEPSNLWAAAPRGPCRGHAIPTSELHFERGETIQDRLPAEETTEELPVSETQILGTIETESTPLCFGAPPALPGRRMTTASAPCAPQRVTAVVARSVAPGVAVTPEGAPIIWRRRLPLARGRLVLGALLAAFVLGGVTGGVARLINGPLPQRNPRGAVLGWLIGEGRTSCLRQSSNLPQVTGERGGDPTSERERRK